MDSDVDMAFLDSANLYGVDTPVILRNEGLMVKNFC
jgi:hypothetical protein